MCDRHHGIGKGSQHFLREDVAYKSRVFVGDEDAVVIYHNPAPFLPAVLQSIEAVVAILGDRCRVGRVNAENAAFFMEFVR